MGKISLCIIAKDEEKLISNAINSAKDFVDEIIVVDTGSKDRTVEIAKSFTDKVFKVNFENDFSKIRNFGISKANSEWVLFLDCDEELDSFSSKNLKNVIEDEYVAISFRVSGILDRVKRSAVNDIRLIKKDRDIFFSGKIGESALKSIINTFGREKINYTTLEIKHFGNDKNLVNLESKVSRNLKIYNSISNKERDGEYYFKLGNEYGRLNNFKKALEMYNISLLKCDCGDWIEELPRLIINKVKALHMLKCFDEEEMFISKWLKVYKEFKDLYFMKTLLYRDKGEFKKSYDSLLSYLEKRENIIYPSSAFDEFIDLKKFKDELFYLSQIIS